MERLTAIQQALEIIENAKFQTALASPGAWQQLYRVSVYLKEQHVKAYAVYFGEAA